MQKLLTIALLILACCICACSRVDDARYCISAEVKAKDNSKIRNISALIAKKYNSEYVDDTKIMGPGDDLSIHISGSGVAIQIDGSTSINEKMKLSTPNIQPIPTSICFSGDGSVAKKMFDEYSEAFRNASIAFTSEARDSAMTGVVVSKK